jgi:hypothetical protein
MGTGSAVCQQLQSPRSRQAADAVLAGRIKHIRSHLENAASPPGLFLVDRFHNNVAKAIAGVKPALPAEDDQFIGLVEPT